MDRLFGDARLEELQLLVEMDRQGKVPVSPIMMEAHRDMVAFLVSEEYVTDPTVSWDHVPEQTYFDLPGESGLERTLNAARLKLLSQVLGKQPVDLRLTHKGRVRLSELRQALRGGREREPFGILWDVRHWEQDVQIANMEAGAESPFALAYLDMNGLKQINDTHGHDDGDLALRTYFQAVASALSDGGQAYRLSGGADEVLVALPNRDEQAAVQVVRLACTKLMSERLWPMDPSSLLSIAAGIIVSTDPNASPRKLRSAADELQKKAKERSKHTTPRPSVIAVSGTKDLIIIEHDSDSGGFPVRITGSYFENVRKEKGITFTVTNTGRETLPPFKVGLFHPKLGYYFLFPSEKSGPLLPDQRRAYSCPVIQGGHVLKWIPKLTHDRDGQPLTSDDDAHFEFQLVLEDSDKVLCANKRIGRGLTALIRRAVADGTEIGGTGQDWLELNNALPDEFVRPASVGSSKMPPSDREGGVSEA